MVNNSTKLNYVSVSGYGWTGSSACFDLLREFREFEVIPGEFRIAKDPYGLADLENSLLNNWDFIRHDVAIRDFLNYCNVLSRDTDLFSRSGKNFSYKLSVDFMHESTRYIEKLCEMTYLGDTFVHRYDIPAYRNLIMKIRTKLGKNNAKPMYYSRPDEGIFLEETKIFIDNLFDKCIKDNNISTIVLDQAIPPTNIYNCRRYFSNIKTIIIDRDPRDIYVNMIRGKGLLGPELTNKDSAKKYIKWHKQLRRMSAKDINNDANNQVLRIYFEDLVLNYDEAILKIIDFLDIKKTSHEFKGEFFIPSYSVGNIGIWKNYKDQTTMSIIFDELSMYCYEP